MPKTSKQFFLSLLEKVGVEPQKQEEIIKTLTNTLTVTALGVLTYTVPEDQQKALGEKLAVSDNWMKVLVDEAIRLGEKESIKKDLETKISQKVDEFIDFLVKSCPEEKRPAVLAYLENSQTV